MMRKISQFLSAATALLFATFALGHPVPDLPVRTTFSDGKTCRITIEIDIRCFSPDPLNEPYLLNWVLEEMDASERDALASQAAALLEEGIAFRFAPAVTLAPEFDFNFTTSSGEPLREIDDPVMLTAAWETDIPSGVDGYEVEALSTGKFDVVFRNTIDGREVERFQVLFPGEKSYTLGISTPPKASKPAVKLIAAAGPAAESPPPAMPTFLPFVLITAVIAFALVVLHWARRNRGI